jgi:hypothetical protein
MQERLLHFIWQFQYFNKQGLGTIGLEQVNIVHPGYANRNAGPDFLNAKIEIDGILWSGNVEIHVNSSDWEAHNHHLDEAYNNVMFHVVWENDKNIFRKDGTSIPTLELKHKTRPSLLKKYNDLINNPDKTPCGNSFREVKEISVMSMIDRAFMQRVEHKTEWIHQILDDKKGDWEEIAYQALAKNMGFKINSEAFLLLAKSLPYKILGKHNDQPLQIEALLFGQAGFLDELFDDHYYKVLQKEYEFLSHKYSLRDKKLSRFQWKFMRMRPANFPTIRLAQLAALLMKNNNLFGLMRDFANKKHLETALMAVQSGYWQEHYDFGKTAKRINHGITKEGAANIMINTAAPLLIAYGKATDNQHFVDKAIDLLSEIPAENNHIMTMWKDMGVNIKNAFDSQGLLELFNDFCSKKRCIHCNIGMQLLQT